MMDSVVGLPFDGSQVASTVYWDYTGGDCTAKVSEECILRSKCVRMYSIWESRIPWCRTRLHGGGIPDCR